MVERKRYQAQIAGKNYTIQGSQHPDHLDNVVELVNLQLEQLAQLAPDLSKEDLAILMAINAISDQLLKEKRIMDLERKLDPGQLAQLDLESSSDIHTKDY